MCSEAQRVPGTQSHGLSRFLQTESLCRIDRRSAANDRSDLRF